MDVQLFRCRRHRLGKHCLSAPDFSAYCNGAELEQRVFVKTFCLSMKRCRVFPDLRWNVGKLMTDFPVDAAALVELCIFLQVQQVFDFQSMPFAVDRAMNFGAVRTAGDCQEHLISCRPDVGIAVDGIAVLRPAAEADICLFPRTEFPSGGIGNLNLQISHSRSSGGNGAADDQIFRPVKFIRRVNGKDFTSVIRDFQRCEHFACIE